MTEFRVGCSPITGTIYAGNVRVLKDGIMEWTSNRHEVTDMAVDAVVDRLAKLPDMMEKYTWEIGGKQYVLKLVEYQPKEGE